ncbi:MAG TPA: helicase-related protein, partial [Anaerolineales bacterium]|nr:helicase-related protein [Anaerolineales bacterium]
LLQLTPNPREHFQALEMNFLSTASGVELINGLEALPALYRGWLSGLKLDEVPAGLQDAARQNLHNCEVVANRIEHGIQLIKEDEQVREAFQLANKAMLIQRGRVTWLKMPADKRPPVPVLDESHTWRPFQLGFILLCLPSIANPEIPDRQLVDLLWFPTGGGKTEAYLGLTAFTIFLRRMRGAGRKITAGVTVLMRYTLRLLTIQQFQRASTLIMACETIRRQSKGKLGEEEINLGLWVGGAATPNRLSQAKTALEQLLQGERVLEGNPYQIHNCPWCGTPITPRHYRIGVTLVIHCPNEGCEFATALPLYLVDEDIYRRRPSLLIGTVDKFARLPWLAEAGAIFGRPDGETLPPELIIQDELHLISGPLGSLVGLYETAIDRLCQQNGSPPKIIASTATIRRAAEQSKGLFNRGLGQFPPPALDARDNFFSWQISPDVRPGRLYAGVHAPGKSMKTALLRIYAVLLQRIFEHTAEPALRDPYWTLVGYFNSLRELGGALRLVEDDVRDRMKLLASRAGVKQRYINYYRELNSRIGSDEIPEILDHMSKSINAHSAIDVVLATNMISVGMDIDRLGLMVVNGQPKMTSEYIQATSRIGRQYPGLVVTLYNWTRPRDRSHYEGFVPYHSSIYSQVEPTSVTPYSNRARDRGLAGVFITLMRHLYSDLNPEQAAGNFDPISPDANEVIEAILARVSEIDPVEVDEVRQELEYIRSRWGELSMADNLTYGRSYKNPALPHLMDPVEEVHGADILSFPTLNSLRDV